MLKTGAELRKAAREGRFSGQTSGQAVGFIQANLAILPKDWAYDFLLFAQRNPKPCPVLEVGDVGDPTTRFVADGADIRTDLPKYRVYRHGELEMETPDIKDLWQDDFVFFLLGCSFTFEQALMDAGLKIRHIEEDVTVPMYRTSIPCHSAGKFEPSPMVVSMRPFQGREVIRAVEVTRDFPAVHGSPVHIGDPSKIGIADLTSPDWGDAVTLQPDDVPVFWACGVTPQMAAIVARPPLMITHAPGHMFVGDRRDSDYRL
ncbi:MAG: putative hydro-lyase [Desulfobacterales bacterium]